MQPAKQCGDCAMCCYLGEIPDFKPYNIWCTHCPTQQRCDAYETRPKPCRDFFCHYLLSDLGEEWRPTHCHMVISTRPNPNHLLVSVDPIYPEIWRESPYLQQITHWANQGPVIVMVGLRSYAIYPNRIDDLGTLAEDEQLEILEQQMLQSVRYQVRRAKRCAPSNPA